MRQFRNREEWYKKTLDKEQIEPTQDLNNHRVIWLPI